MNVFPAVTTPDGQVLTGAPEKPTLIGFYKYVARDPDYRRHAWWCSWTFHVLPCGGAIVVCTAYPYGPARKPDEREVIQDVTADYFSPGEWEVRPHLKPKVGTCGGTWIRARTQPRQRCNW